MTTAAAAYTVTYQDKCVSFSWTRNTPPMSQYSDLIPPTGGFTDDLQASAAQATDIMRRRSGQDAAGLPLPAAWIPQIIYNHLALVEDQDWPAPNDFVVCPEDATRMRWKGDWNRFVTGGAQPQPTGSESNPQLHRWFFSASYNFVPASMAPDYGPNAILNVGSHSAYYPPADPNSYGKRKFIDVQAPASKVWPWSGQSLKRGGVNRLVLRVDSRRTASDFPPAKFDVPGMASVAEKNSAKATAKRGALRCSPPSSPPSL